MKKNWIDFRALRQKLDAAQVLKHYGVEVKSKGGQHHGYCPLPNHNGKRNSPSFSVNLERGIFHCFGCGSKGNVLDFAVLMAGKDLHAVALELQERFCPKLEIASEQESSSKPSKQAEEPKDERPRIVNGPLDFELKGLDAKHPYLLERGFTPETIERFGLGYCSRGFLKSRIGIPLHDANGKLIGFAGRVVDDSKVTEENPRYKFPGERERDGTIHEFKKSLFLYNGYRIKAPIDDLIVVESFTAVWWLVQNNLSNVVATMGADCSEKQAELIVALVRPGGLVWVITDGDKAGERHGLSVLTQVAPHRAIRWVKMPDGKQPTDLSGEELKLTLLG